MAKLGDYSIGSSVYIYWNSTYRVFNIIDNTISGEVWLAAIPASVTNTGAVYITSTCQNFLRKLDSDIYKKIILKDGQKAFILSYADASRIKGKYPSARGLADLFGPSWLSTTVGGTSRHYWLTANNTIESSQKSGGANIVPVFVLPSSIEVSGTGGRIDGSGKHWEEAGVTKIPTPTLSQTSFNYDGNTHEPTIEYHGYENCITTTKNYSGKQSEIGSYTISFTLKDTMEYIWSSGSISGVSVSWTIKSSPITTVPTPNKTLTYNGSEQTMTFDGFDASLMTVSGNKGTNAGTYIAVFTPKTGNTWADGSASSKSVTWRIEKKSISPPTQKGTLTYNGGSQSPQWDNYNSAELSIGGTLSGVNAGAYTATFTPDSNYCWVDGSVSTKNVDWAIGRQAISPPKQVGELIYNKNRQSPTWDTNDNLTIVEDIGAVDAGSYPAVFRCDKNHSFNRHDEGNEQQVTVYWTIKRSPTATPPVIVEGKFEYDGEEHRPTWDVKDTDTVYLDGELSATNAGKYTIMAYPTSNYCWSDKSTAGKPYSWEVTRKPISKDPGIRNATLEYSGEEQSPEWLNYPQDFVFGEGVSALEVGEYLAVFTIDENHCWTNKTYAPLKIKWKIDRKKISKPTYSGSFIYNGQEQSPNWAGYNKAEIAISGDTSGVHAGDYTTVFTPSENYQWIDGGYEPYSVTWSIAKYRYRYPFQAENRNPNRPDMYDPTKPEVLVYNGESQTPTLWFGNAYSGSLTTLDYEKAFTVGKTQYAVNVGDYVVELTPDSDHCWEDGNSNPYDVPWRIMKRKLEDPTQDAKGLIIPSPRGEQYYTGEVIYPEFNNYDPDILEMSGQTSAIDVGDYVVYFDIRDKDNYEWSDGRTDKVSVTWRIINPPKLVGYPYQSNYLIYNGKYQSPEWEFYDPNAMILIGGNPRKIDVGEYSVEFKLKRGYAWIDGKTENATVEWSIDKIKVKCPSVRGADMYGNGGQYLELGGKLYPVWDDYVSDVMMMSGDTYAVDDLLHTTMFTLKEPDIYTWNTSPDESVEVKWKLTTPYEPDKDDSDEDDSTPDDDQTDSDEDPVIPADIVGMPGVVDIPPSELPSLITSGDYIEELHPGDVFPIELNGVVGGVEFRHAWFFAYIIGLDHNSEIEGEKTVHFQFAKRAEDGQEIAFTDKYYGQLGDSKSFCVNKTDTASGGWKDSYMRAICREFFYAMPKAWRKILIPCPKYTDNVGGSNFPESVTMTNDKIFLPSEYECIGRSDLANSAEENYQEQYLYYELNGFRGKRKYGELETKVKSWLRSPVKNSDSAFCSVDYSENNLYGESEESEASLSLGFAPCFAVGGIGSFGTGEGYTPDDTIPDSSNSGGGEITIPLKRVHIPQQIYPPFEDGTTKTPQWDEYNATAIVNLGGVWEGIPAGTYHVVLRLNPGYIWEDGTTEVKIVPWRILSFGEAVPTYSPIKVHIPEQINPPHYDGQNKTPEWDEWNENAINVVGGNSYGVVAVDYTIKVELRPGYVWEDGTTGKKYLPWVILPSGSVTDSSDNTSNEEAPEIIEQGEFISNKPYDEVEGDIDNSSGGRVNCCCGCDTGLFDMLNNTQCDDGAVCDCTKNVEI